MMRIAGSLIAAAAVAAEHADTLSVPSGADTLLRTDTVRLAERLSDLAPAADTLTVSEPLDLASAADTLAAAEPFDPVLTAGQAFGAASELVAGHAPGVPFSEALTDHPLFQGIVLLLAVAYMLMICARFHDIASLFSRHRGESTREGGGMLGIDGTVQTAAFIGLLMTAVLAVRFIGVPPDPLYGTMGLLMSALAAVFGIVLFQCGALHLVGRITLTSDLTRAIVHFKILFFGLITVAAMPPALLLVLCPPGGGRFWLCSTLLLAGTVVILFLKESFALFLTKKVSILHWFLYLCTVECFPISLVWLLATRC